MAIFPSIIVLSAMPFCTLFWKSLLCFFPCLPSFWLRACSAASSILRKAAFLHSTMSDIIGFVAYLAVGAAVLACLISVLSSVFSCVEAMKTQMELVYPVLLTLMRQAGERCRRQSFVLQSFF